MKTFAIKDGDFVPGQGGFVQITGIEKLRQDLAIALQEPLGSDQYHPKWGSLLSSLVGQTTDASTATIQSEVNRILSNYINIQQALLGQDKASGNKPRFSAGEVIREILSVDVTPSYDSVIVKITLQTFDGSQLDLTSIYG